MCVSYSNKTYRMSNSQIGFFSGVLPSDCVYVSSRKSRMAVTMRTREREGEKNQPVIIVKEKKKKIFLSIQELSTKARNIRREGKNILTCNFFLCPLKENGESEWVWMSPSV